MHWVLERQHADGGWEACNSTMLFICEMGAQIIQSAAVARDPRFLLHWADCTRYELVLGEGRDPSLALGERGLPHDTSFYAAAGLSSTYFVGQACLSPARLRQVARGTRGFTLEDRQQAASMSRCLKAILARPEWVAEILRGSPYDDYGEPCHPTLAMESNHQQFRRLERSAGLLPPDDDTVRILVAFDG